jgi:hypothetical protein
MRFPRTERDPRRAHASLQRARAGVARVGGNAARVAGASAGGASDQYLPRRLAFRPDSRRASVGGSSSPLLDAKINVGKAEQIYHRPTERPIHLSNAADRVAEELH